MARAGNEQIFREMGFASREGRPGEAFVYGLARTYNLLSRELAQVYGGFGLTAASFNLLMLLKHGRDPGSCTQQVIGGRLVVSPSDMTGLIDRLERRGLVKRTPGRDRRCKLLWITAQGAKLLDAVWPHHLETVKRLIAGLSERQMRTVVQVLGKLRGGLGG